MLAKLKTFALVGIEAVPVEVEVDVSPAGLPKTMQLWTESPLSDMVMVGSLLPLPTTEDAAMSIVYSYRRFSSGEQVKGISLERQTERATAWLSKHPAHTLDTTLRMTDLGVSAFRGRHRDKGALGGFLQAITDGRVSKGSILLVESLDRLSRQEIEEALELFLGIIRSGVAIITLAPEEREWRKGKLDMTALIIAIVEMSRANAESERKADFARANWKKKRDKLHERKLTGACPMWLELSDDGKRFKRNPEAVATIRKIYRMVLDGIGLHAIVNELNQTHTHCFGKRPTWQRSYIAKLLHNRAVLGEYRPRSYRKETGDVIPDYYPRVIDDDVFYRVQAVLSGRKRVSGPRAGVRNLFSGLIFDSRDGSPMVVLNKGKGKYGGLRLVSGNSRDGSGPKYVSLPHDRFERAFLGHMSTLKPEDIMPNDNRQATLADALQAEEGRLADIDKKIAEVSKAMLTNNLDTLLTVARQLEEEKRELHGHIEHLKGELSHNVNTSLVDGQNIIELLEGTKGEELIGLRLRLREAIRGVVERIEINPEDKNGVVRYRGGTFRWFMFAGQYLAVGGPFSGTFAMPS